jgi:EmrB/QacA subfamily drug resistance transporter
MTSARPAPSGRLLLLTLAAAGGSFALMQAIIVPALPEVQRDLGTSTAWVAWTVSIYLLSAAVATPLLGRLGDQFGKERMLIVTLAAFTVGSIGCILAPNISSLIVARAVQGVSGAVYPLCFSIIRDEVPRERMGVAMGLISAMLGVGGGLGLVLSGPVVDHGSWRLLFVFGAVLGVVAIALVRRYVPPSPTRAPATLDLPGAALLSAGLVAILVALTEGDDWGWGSGRVVGLGAAGLAVLVIWGAVEARTARPMVDMRMLARRPVLFTNLAGLFCGFTMYATFTVLPLFAQMPHGLPADLRPLVDYGFDTTVTGSALLLLPGALVMLPAGPYGGVLGRRIGSRNALVAGMAVTALGAGLMAGLHEEAWQLVIAYVIGAAGVAIAFGAMPKLIADAVAPTETGVATGMNTVVRTVGSAIGAQVAVTLLAARTLSGTEVPAESGFTISLWLATGAAVVAAVMALAIAPRRTAPREASATSPG